MSAKPKILFIGDYCRTDYLRLLDNVKDACDFLFLYFASPKEEQNKSYQQYGQAVYWSDFESAQALLQSLTPRKVLYLYIDTYNALVLNIACKAVHIPTYHLEHGMRADYAVAFDTSISPELHQKPFRKLANLATLLQNPRARVKARLFLKNSIRQFSADDAAFVKEFVATRSKHNYLETYKQLPSSKRIADCYISFSPKVYQTHQRYDQLETTQKVYFIGIPYFDKLASVTPKAPQRAILFIDQPLAENRLLQWTPAYKRDFIAQLLTITNHYNYKLYVKPHPSQDISLWQRPANVELIDDTQLQEICGTIPLVMGFYSTYLLPFASFNHTTLITLENHPAGKLDVSKSFVYGGVAHPVYELDELSWALENIEQLHKQQLPNKAKFTEDWLYKFDGRAGERLRGILLKDKL